MSEEWTLVLLATREDTEVKGFGLRIEDRR
jgi:hypothetical protein